MAPATIGSVFLIPCFLDEGNTRVLPTYVVDAAKQCQVFFVENERSARRYLKLIWKEIVIDEYEWFTIHKAEKEVTDNLVKSLRQGKNVGIISEAGCPGVADPGQLLVAAAHDAGAMIRPLVGPSSILLALMGSGMNGQQFQFNGYLPIDHAEKTKMLRELEVLSSKKQSTQIFIETPYRNNQLLESITKTCLPSTRLCIAVDLTSDRERIQTKTIAAWKKELPDIHKRPAIFLIYAG